VFVLERAGVELDCYLTAKGTQNGFIHRTRFEFNHETESLGVLVLEMLDSTETLEMPVHHYPKSGAESFTFFHTTDNQSF